MLRASKAALKYLACSLVSIVFNRVDSSNNLDGGLQDRLVAVFFLYSQPHSSSFMFHIRDLTRVCC
jgi:hypothetical protein